MIGQEPQPLPIGSRALAAFLISGKVSRSAGEVERHLSFNLHISRRGIIALHGPFVEVRKFDDHGVHCLPCITFAFQPHGGRLTVLFSIIVAI